MSRNILFLLLILFSIDYSFGQVTEVDEVFLQGEGSEEQEMLKAIVLYPDDVIQNVLIVASNPVVLSRIGIMQQNSRKNFIALIQDLDEEVQKDLWDISRYPGLLEALVYNDIIKINSYPAEVIEKASYLKKDYYDVIEKMYDLQSSNENYLGELLSQLNLDIQKAFNNLIELPEIFSLLYENIDRTILIGDEWFQDPNKINNTIDSLSIVAAEEHTKELEDWKRKVENNPELVEELKELQEEYAEQQLEEKNYADDLYSDYDDEVYEDIIEEDYNTTVIHKYYNYPYWFGYPYWHEVPRWRPYPTWYDWGFYWSASNTLIVVDLPSSFFVHWYFSYPLHYRWYPRVTNRFIDHHYGHRSHGSSIYAGVSSWKKNNSDVVIDSWLRNKTYRNKYLNEFSEMEVQRTRYNETNQNQKLNQKEYLSRYSSRYKNLSEARKFPRSKIVSPRKKIEQKPIRKKTTTYRQPIEKSKTKDDLNKIKRANDYHKQKWTKPKTKTKTISPRTVTKSTKVKKSTSKRKKKNNQ